MDIFAAWRVLWKRLDSTASSVRAYITLRTSDLIDQSESPSPRLRMEHTARLGLLALGSLVGCTVLALGGASPPIPNLVRTWVLWLLAAFALSLPIWVVLKFVAKQKSLFFLANLIIIQQFFCVGAVGISALILNSMEPARGDFALMRSGMGQHTLAYRTICEPISNTAEKLRNARQTLDRSDAEIAAGRIMNRQLIDGSLNTGSVTMPESSKVIERARLAIEQSRTQPLRHEALARSEAANSASFAERYPNAIYAALVTALGCVVTIVISSIHVWKAGVWLSTTWSRKIAVATCLLGGWLLSLVIIIVLALLWNPKPSLPASPLVMPSASSDQLQAALSLLDTLEEYNRLARQDLELQISELRQRAHAMRYLCPNVDSRGLW